MTRYYIAHWSHSERERLHKVTIEKINDTNVALVSHYNS